MDNSFLHTKKLLLVDDKQELLKMVSMSCCRMGMAFL